MSERVSIKFGGVEFKGIAHGKNHVTVPRPALVKILRAGKVIINRSYSYTDDYLYDAANNYGKREGIPPQAILNDPYHRHVLMESHHKPWLLCYNPEKHEICYCPHSNESYTIKEVTTD